MRFVEAHDPDENLERIPVPLVVGVLLPVFSLRSGKNRMFFLLRFKRLAL